jgi:hypothetical protein
MSESVPSGQPSGCEPPSPEKQQRAAERTYWERQLRISKWLNLITGIAAAAGIVGLIILYVTVKVASRQADTAIEANKAALAALHQTQRPWVSAEGLEVFSPPATVLATRPNHFEFFIGVDLKNTGPSIAIKGFTIIHGYPGIGNALSQNWGVMRGSW